jgi:hypothetical protein
VACKKKIARGRQEFPDSGPSLSGASPMAKISEEKIILQSSALYLLVIFSIYLSGPKVGIPTPICCKWLEPLETAMIAAYLLGKVAFVADTC